MSQPKLILRPPPHREFIQGYPGIVGANGRPPAHVAGTVEVRLGTKGLKAAWLRIELRKLETLPGGESWGELIGRGPIDVWAANKEDAHKAESEKGWELLQTADFPFQISIPEGLPPSAKLEKNAGVGYELVTSLCVRSKKGLLKKETTSSIIQNTHPLWLDKHELHSTWPVYATTEDHEAIQDDIRVKVMRDRTCFGPGDNVDVRIILTSDRVSPIKVKSISFSIRETITFKGGAKKAFSSSKAASQKVETLSTKSKSLGKKVYKGDTHTFDLACQIPRNHTLMTIQTAKHIEVSYTLRVQVETAKKPIIIDHLPIIVSNFTKTASDALMARIGWVPGLSAPGESLTTDTYASDYVEMPPSRPTSTQQPTISRSMSFADSTYSGSRSSYPGYAGGDLRRRDTVMTQGTAISGPGMAGRGVPGQVFSWGQYGSAQPFGGGGEGPRLAFAGPPSIYDGGEMQPEESRAMFHSTNRPQSGMVLNAVVDPVLVPTSSYHGHSGAVTPIVEGSEDGHANSSFAPYAQHGHQGQMDMRRHSHLPNTAPSSDFHPAPTARYSLGGAAPAGNRYTASPVDGRSPFAEQAPSRGPMTPEIGTTRIVRPEPVHQSIPSQLQPGPAAARGSSGSELNGAMTSAEAEKQQLYERARQQAERNQRRADERRALHQGVASPVRVASPLAAADRDRPFSMSNIASSSATPSAAPTPLTAEQEKMRLFERARAEAEQYQSSYTDGSAFGSSSGGAGSSSAAGPSAPPQPVQSTAQNPMVSGRAAPYPSYMTAEEEKRQLYERAKAEADAYQRGEGSSATISGPSSAAQPVSMHQQAASLSNGNSDIPGAFPKATTVVASGSSSAAGPSSSIVPPATTTAAVSEKEQLRRYYEAQSAVNARLSAQTPPVHTPEVASAVHHATPHQPADTVPTPPASSTPRPAFFAQSYLTEAEQQSAEEKERLASHYAKKTARAQARSAAASSAVAATTSTGTAGGAGPAVGEKAQLAAYYAARDAMEHNLATQASMAGSSSATNGTAANGSAVKPSESSSSTNGAPATISSTFRNSTNGTYHSSADQWRPKYNSLYDDDDGDDSKAGAAAAPPPLPPKIPIGSGFTHRSTASTGWS
ncbi:Arrestin C-terminal-like domain protein [Kalmanozyma brasiliensis GHG001]|uniref:Arrestin C-terminal-like domain-containing protein n=1 Tax=Kalmanozyma brasiliensis (strain GHG001) TaxID=1365824 RepID=V5EZA2_KALBG|nr:Arrestin C-terminal-like domain protein [Kalmanozyma brasiliensis GHG001]EST08169.1 Arrestin C-terminal-like domain protein [Kalmanozyma brasiliensis GHG001]